MFDARFKRIMPESHVFYSHTATSMLHRWAIDFTTENTPSHSKLFLPSLSGLTGCLRRASTSSRKPTADTHAMIDSVLGTSACTRHYKWFVCIRSVQRVTTNGFRHLRVDFKFWKLQKMRRYGDQIIQSAPELSEKKKMISILIFQKKTSMWTMSQKFRLAEWAVYT